MCLSFCWGEKRKQGPQEQLETFEIADGYVIECVASEPMIQEPVLAIVRVQCAAPGDATPRVEVRR